MRSVFGLRQMLAFKNKKAGKWFSEPIISLSHPPPENSNKPSAVFIAFPSKPFPLALSQTRTDAYKYVFVQKPASGPGFSKPKALVYTSQLTKLVYKIVPAATCMISICTLIGLYYMIVKAAPHPSYFSASLATPSQLPLPKKRPSQSDAVASEYQHAITTEWIAAADTASHTEAKNKKTKERKEAKKRMVTVTASPFAASEKKGIRNLELKVSNGSAHMLEKVVLQVDFLKANGTLLHTENFTTGKVPAHGSKMIKVPAGTKGKKIAFRIIEVKSHSYTTTLQYI